MLAVISPAKTLDLSLSSRTHASTQPQFLEQAAELIEILRQYSPPQLAELMHLSDALATLNCGRYHDWHTPFTPENAKAAVLMFMGDVYEGLDAASLSDAELNRAQQHLRILSGLYGLLRPLDLIQAYRLEMGTKLPNPAGKTLYAFWGERLTHALNHAFSQQTSAPILINLASEEYFKAIKAKHLRAQTITPVFMEYKNGQNKIISFYAKRARGLMSRYMIQNALSTPQDLRGFDTEGYQYCAAASTEERWVFIRNQKKNS